MGKKGGSRHLKRKPATRFWPIHRKEAVWTVKPRPGPHPIERCLPLLLIVREILGFAKTRREAKIILSQGKVMVDGVVRRDEKFPAGVMDVISIPETGQNYRILPSKKGLILHPIDGEEVKFKPCRIENKSTVKGGKIQLNLHDGRNILIHVKDPRKPEEDVYHTLDTLVISVPSQEIIRHLRMIEGAYAIITGGKNMGVHGRIVKIEETPGRKRRKSLVTVEDKNGNSFQTTLEYIFTIGEAEPIISLPEVQ